jgi:hypothetical protein
MGIVGYPQLGALARGGVFSGINLAEGVGVGGVAPGIVVEPAVDDRGRRGRAHLE